MALVFALVSTKGGTGKSTLCVELAVHLADLGFSVALIEADNQTSSSSWLSKMESDVRLLILESVDHGARAVEITALVKQLRDEVDVIMIDTKGDATLETTAGVNNADVVLMPIQPSANDLEEFERTVGIIYTSKEMRAGKPEAHIILTFTADNDPLIQDVRELAQSCKLPMARTNIKRLLHYRNAPAMHTVTTRRRDKEGKKAGDRIRLLFKEIIKPYLPKTPRRVANA